MPLSKKFFDQLRQPLHDRPALFPTFTQQQVDSLNTITAVFDAFTGHDHCIDDLAYIMATCNRECGHDLDLTIEEYGHGSTKAYGKPAGPWNKKYYGRGPPQLTWLANYQKAKLATGIDFVQYPEYMCVPAKGVVYMVDAMYNARFTKYGLRNFITPGKLTTFAAFVLCRKIVNGEDHAEEIAYAALALHAALVVGYVPTVVPPLAKKVTTQPITKTKQLPRLSLMTGIRNLFSWV